MCNPRHLLVTFLLGALAICLLFGCRAWEPETVIVNKPPKIYIIGAPAETSGGYFHFHVFWYGTDEDGYVDRYVWALTDTSVQDRQTPEDEEDRRFNPALDISTLRIGNWTTRTDTVFDFRIEQGPVVQRELTLHLVAVDNEGAFSRHPARLNFFSNALGNPRIRFIRGDDQSDFTVNNVVGYGRPIYIRWSGTTPNITNYDPARLALIDTVGDVDGLLGFKWRLPLLDGCNPAIEDCWQPRRFREATGESLSFFGTVTGLDLLNEDPHSTSLFRRRFDAGNLRLLVNTIDIAGVEPRPENRVLNIQVNYPPQVCIIGANAPDPDGLPPGQSCGQSPFEDQEYPYFIVFHGPRSRERWNDPHHHVSNPYIRYPFSEGDRIPDRAYVVFKALGWEEVDEQGQPRDMLLTTYAMRFQGVFTATGYPGGGSLASSFTPTRSILDSTTAWTMEVATDVSADTLGFQVGPFDYMVTMRSADEHETRSNPATFSFSANYRPCVQCIEVANNRPATMPTITYEDDCYLDDCFDTEDVLLIRQPEVAANRFQLAREAEPMTIYVNVARDLVQFTQPVDMTGWHLIAGYTYYYMVFLHGRKESDFEYWPPGQAHRRIAAWKYQIDYAGDPTNIIRDGGGVDDDRFLSGFGLHWAPLPSDIGIINPNENIDGQYGFRGAWFLRVTVGVPQLLMLGGAEVYWESILADMGEALPPIGTPEDELRVWQARPGVQTAKSIYRLTTMQFTPGEIRAQAADQSRIAWRPQTNCYNFYFGTRMPTLVANDTRQCGSFPLPEGFILQGQRDLSRFAAFSEWRVKRFDIHLYPDGSPQRFVGGTDPPRWIPSKGMRGPWR